MKPRSAHLVSFLSGLVFAVGLGISGMTRPGKVLAFLDVAGTWDPTLLFVMGGAIAVHIGFALRAKRASAPLLGERYDFPARDSVDVSLVLGASLFGVGWGLQGYCPGPAVVAATSGGSVPIVFVVFMVAGFALPKLYQRPSALPNGPIDSPPRDSPTAA